MDTREVTKLIDRYWKFDEDQFPVSTWHDKQSLINELDKMSSHEPGKTKIKDWDKLDKCSQRLKGALFNIMQGTWLNYRRENIEDIDINKMGKLPNCSEKTIAEFVWLRGF